MILIANDGDKTVATIGARNALERRFDGMQVTVLDAIADVNVGGGRAGYIWSETFNEWLLTWKSSNKDLKFYTESHVIAAGAVNTDYLPQDGIVWGGRIIDGDGLIVAEVRPQVTGTRIDLGSPEYDGLTLELTYGCGAGIGGAFKEGMMMQTSSASAPDGWMFSEGQLLPVSYYPVLFSVLGNRYGGDGIANFALPNKRNRSEKCIIFTGRHPQCISGVRTIATLHGPASGHYVAGNSLTFDVYLLDEVEVAGNPVINLAIGNTVHQLAFSSGTATHWTFADYLVAGGDAGEVSATLDLNGATVTTNAGNYAVVLNVSSLVAGITVGNAI